MRLITNPLLICAFLLIVTGCNISQTTGSGGDIISVSGNYDCTEAEGSCLHAVPSEGISETFTAMPKRGYSFDGWSGQCKGQDPCEVNLSAAFATVDADFSMIAAFSPTPPPVISEFNASYSVATLNTVVDFSWTISDPDEDAVLTCGLDVDNDGSDDYTLDDCSSLDTLSHAFPSSGTFSVRLSVTDGATSVSETTSVTIQPLLLNVSSPGVAVADGTVLYQLTVSNISAVPATDIDLTYRVPAGITFHYVNAVEPNGSGCTGCSEGAELSWTPFTLAAGESRTFSINASVDAGLASGTSIDALITLVAPSLSETISITKSIEVYNTPKSQLALSADRDPVLAGEEYTLDLDVGNIGAQSLGNTELRLQLPAGASVVSISDSGSEDVNGDVVWDLGSVAVASNLKRSVTISAPDAAVGGQLLLARAELRHDGGIELDASAEHVVSVQEEAAPLELVVTATPDPVEAGSTVLYQLTVSNVSAVPATDIDLTYRVPEGITFHYVNAVEPNGSGCTGCSAGLELSWAPFTLAAGESRTFSISATVDGGLASGTLISAPVTLISTNLEDTISVFKTIGVYNTPKSQLALSADRDPVLAGEEYTLDLDVGNIGAQSLGNTELRLQLPAGASVVSISDSGSEDVNGDVVWDLGSVAVASNLKRSVTISAPDAAVGGQLLLARAELRHDGGIELDASAEHVVSVQEEAAPLELVVTATPDPVEAGSTVLYQLTVSNVSAVPATDIDLTYRVPEGITFHYVNAVEPNGSGCTGCSAGLELSWALFTLAAGESRTFSISATVDAGLASGTLISAPVTLISTNLEDTISVFKTIGVYNTPKSQLALSADRDPVLAGEEYTLDLDVGNIGAQSLGNTELRLQLPAGASVVSISDSGSEDVNGDVVWDLGSVAVASGLKRSVTISAPNAAVGGQLLLARAELRHDGGIELDASAEHVVSVQEEAAPLELVVTATPDPVEAGSTVLYQLTVSNVSAVPATDIDLTYRVPEGVSFHYVNDVEPNGSGCTGCSAGLELSWTPFTLAAGEETTFTINATVDGGLTSGTLISAPITLISSSLEDTISIFKTVQVDNN